MRWPTPLRRRRSRRRSRKVRGQRTPITARTGRPRSRSARLRASSASLRGSPVTGSHTVVPVWNADRECRRSRARPRAAGARRTCGAHEPGRARCARGSRQRHLDRLQPRAATKQRRRVGRSVAEHRRAGAHGQQRGGRVPVSAQAAPIRAMAGDQDVLAPSGRLARRPTSSRASDTPTPPRRHVGRCQPFDKRSGRPAAFMQLTSPQCRSRCASPAPCSAPPGIAARGHEQAFEPSGVTQRGRDL